MTRTAIPSTEKISTAAENWMLRWNTTATHTAT